VEMISKIRAVELVQEIEASDMKPIDAGILQTVINFAMINSLLPITTYTSCEGHSDWGNPFPVIGFVSNHKETPIQTPSWKFWRRAEREAELRHNSEGFLLSEAAVTSVVRFFVRELITYYTDKDIHPTLMFQVLQTDAFSFKILPVYREFFLSKKSEGEFHQLEEVLFLARKELEYFSAWMLDRLSKNSSFEGDGYSDRFRCRGKI
jgi:hypothetical protein